MKKSKANILLLLLSLVLVSFSDTNNYKNDTMITRHDKKDSEFIKIAEKFEKYICHLNLPDCEGTIIADQWVLSAAHCSLEIADKFNAGKKHFVIINDEEIEVDRVIMHPSWMVKKDDSDEDDIALLHLKTKPKVAMQAKLYMKNDEVDKLIYMVGKGDKGNGLIGVNGNDGKQRGATNRIERANEKWLFWTFDHPDTLTKYLTEYEGISGPGDSGGPAFILKNDKVYLAGISSGQDQKGGDEGLYGVEEFYTRVSQYIQWINDEMIGHGAASNEIYRVAPKPDAMDTRPKAIAINASTLKQYVGEYEIQGVTIKVYTKVNDIKLYVLIPENPELEFIATGKHEFTSKIIEGFKLEFKNPENGISNELIIIQPQPNGKLKAIRK